MHREIPKLVANGFYKEALCLYTKHHSAASALGPNKFTFPYLLKACGKLKSLNSAQMLHTHLIKTGFGVDVYASTALTDVYMKLHLLHDALKVFDEIPDPSLPLLNATISGFAKNGMNESVHKSGAEIGLALARLHSVQSNANLREAVSFVKMALGGYHIEALQIFGQVGLGKLRPNSVTLASLLSSCGSLADGLQVHCWAVKLGVETDVYVGTSLITVYSDLAELVSATKVFDMISTRNVVSYNAYLTGLLQNGVFGVVLDVFKEMKGCSTELPNPVTLVSVISACSGLLYLQFGRQVHGLARKTGMVFDTIVGTAFVDLYSKCSRWKWAYDVFQELNGNRNLITWNSLIAGMMLNGQIENAINLFTRLESEGLKPDSATWNSLINGFTRLGKDGEALMFFKKMQSAGVTPSLKSITSLLPACSALFALRCGKEIHGHAIRIGICKDEFIQTALIDMYMKCGLSPLAQRTFDLFDKNTNDPAIWNAMISGYGKNGQFESGFEIFDQMVEEKAKPNSATFNCVLSMCSHTGKVERGWEVFRMMTRDYGLIPTSDHINRIVDLLGRSGWLDEAREVLQEIIPQPSASVIASLLNASICHSDFKLGEEMAIMLSELEPENPAPIVVLSNIYAGQGRWRDAERIRKTIDDRGLKKYPGLSLIGLT